MVRWFQVALNRWYALSTPANMPTSTTVARERVRKSRLLSLLTLWSFILSSPLFVKDIGYGLSATGLNVALFEAMLILTILINRWGKMELAGYVFIVNYIGQLTWGMFAVERADGVGILWGWAHYALTPIIAGLFLPAWAPLLFGLIDYAIIVWIFEVDTQQGFFTVILHHTGSQNFLTHAAIALFASSVAGMFYAHSQARAIAQADRATELEQAHAELSAANAKLEHLATVDPITGLLNHRALNAQLALECSRMQRAGQPLSVIFGDIDHFKQVNDIWGHQTGDEILAHVAEILRDGVRACDTVARYGGEEFVVLLPGLSDPAAQQTAERLRVLIASTPLMTAERALVVTMSLGVATWPVQAESIEDLISSADAAMYAAKHSGRNRVCVAKRPLDQAA